MLDMSGTLAHAYTHTQQVEASHRLTSHVINHEGTLFTLLDSDRAASVRPRYMRHGVPYIGPVMTRKQFDFCFNNDWGVISARTVAGLDQIIYIPDPSDERMPVPVILVGTAAAVMASDT
jgi:hypothetical protein